MRALFLIAIALAGCGRVDFDPVDTRFVTPRVLVYAHGAGTSQAMLDSLLPTLATPPTSVFTQPLDAALLVDEDIVLVEELDRPYTPSEVTALVDWVTAGGSLMALSAYQNSGTDKPFYDSLFGQWCHYLTPIIDPNAVTEFADHPLVAGLTAVSFVGGFPLVIATPLTPVAFVTGSPVGVAGEVGAGRVYLWGDEWVSLDGGWNPDSPRFWANAFAWLRHRT